VPGAVRGQDIVGQWQGTIHTPDPLRIVLKVARDDGAKLRASLISLDQDPDYVPITNISFENGVLDFSVAMFQSTFHGTENDQGDRIDGTWNPGIPLHLDLQRATEETSWLAKSTMKSIAVAPGVCLEVIDWGGSGPRWSSWPDWATRPASSTRLPRNSRQNTTSTE